MNKVLFLTVFILSLLLFAALSPEVKGQKREGYRIFPREVAHWFGWLGFIFFTISTFYSALKRIFPKGIKSWLMIHCITGIFSIVITIIHIINRIQVLRLGDLVSFLAFLLMVVIVITGILGRFVKVKSHWKILHIS
ncbi:MAG: hypothetical protein QXW34_03065, partial [Candidatus Methanomethyliaceae archaeon]